MTRLSVNDPSSLDSVTGRPRVGVAAMPGRFDYRTTARDFLGNDRVRVQNDLLQARNPPRARTRCPLPVASALLVVGSPWISMTRRSKSVLRAGMTRSGHGCAWRGDNLRPRSSLLHVFRGCFDLCARARARVLASGNLCVTCCTRVSLADCPLQREAYANGFSIN